MAFHGAHIAAAAAAKKRRKMMQEEEERMTKYSPEELNEDWEFKIIRAETPIFRKPEVFQQLLQEEAAAGWQLVEKLDDTRVRLKRSSTARKRDMMLPPGVDPYRTRYGASTRTAMLIIVLLLILVAMGIPILMGVLGESSATAGVLLIIFGILLFVLIAMLVIIRLRR
jgi:hypothetical protein